VNPRVSVIVPTYREAENLPSLVPRVAAAMEGKAPWEVVVVDDDSRDGTEEACARLSERWPLRLVVRRGERGLSSAVLEGVRHASGDVLVVMDADHSHPPETIPALVDALADADFAVGSRYVPGAATDEDWGFLRRLNSWGATLLARPLTRVRDPMAGFFALSRRTFDAAAPLSPLGYKIGLELIVKCRCRRVAEIPIRFAERARGQSKLGVREQIDYLRHLGRLYAFRLGDAPRWVRFVAMGAGATVLDLGTFALTARRLPLALSRAVAASAGAAWGVWADAGLAPASTFGGRGRRLLGWTLGALANWGSSTLLLGRSTAFVSREWIGAVVGSVAGTAVAYAVGAGGTRRPPV
jgi:dolichol-phosphate mannosyltransferase